MADWLLPRWLTVLTGIAAAIPVIASTARGVSEGWFPYGDRAVIAARAFDVLTLHPPLLGQYSAWSSVLTRPIYSPGPLLYWLLALPAHFMAPAALPILIGAVNVAAVMGMVALARRRGGQPLMFATAIAVVLMCRSLTSQTFHDIWDPSSPLLLVTLLFFLAWSVACGEYRLLPVTALVASFVVETHLAFVLATLGLLIVALVGLATSRGYAPGWLRRRRAQPPPASPQPAAPDRGSLKRWAWAAAAITVVSWIPSVVQQILHPPGNLYLIAKAVANRKATLGASAGWHTVVHAIGIPPWWLRHPVGDVQRLFQVAEGPGIFAEGTCVLVLVAIGVALVVALRRNRGEVAAAAAIALVLAAALGLGTASTPTAGLLGLTIGYTLWWASPAGMFVWLATAFSVASLSGISLHRMRPGWARAASPLAFAAAVAVAVAVAAGQSPDVDHGEYRPFGAVANRLQSALPHPGTVLLTADQTTSGFELQAALVYALNRQGASVLLPFSATGNLGSHYLVGHRRYDHRVDIAFNHPPPAGGRVIATVTVRPPAPLTGTFTVTVLPGGAGA